jgi:hypothetical protein
MNNATLTFGLVKLYEPLNVVKKPEPELVESVSGTYHEGLRCTQCSRVVLKEYAPAGSIWRCEQCCDDGEYDLETGACCADADLYRIDDDGEYAEGYICEYCSAAPQVDVEVFYCNECEEALDPADDPEERHLKEHLTNE